MQGLVASSSGFAAAAASEACQRSSSDQRLVPQAAIAAEELKVVVVPVCKCANLQAVGEPPFHLGAAVFFALKDAVYAARANAGLTGVLTC